MRKFQHYYRAFVRSIYCMSNGCSAPRGGGGGGGGGIRGGGNTYNTYVAPPVYGGGYGYGGGALSFFPRPYFPVFGFGLPIGGFFNFVVSNRTTCDPDRICGTGSVSNAGAQRQGYCIVSAAACLRERCPAPHRGT